MSLNLHLLEKLKDKLINSEEFNLTMRYFFDNFGGDPAFLRLGKSEKSQLIEKIVTDAASSSLGKPAKVEHLRITRLPQQKFCHGPCFINGLMASLFYFEDIRTGMMVIVLGNGESRYTRITAVAIQDQPSAKWN